jgi:hypothetical protein
MGASVEDCVVSDDSRAVGSDVMGGFVGATGGTDVLVQLVSKATKMKRTFLGDIVSPGSKTVRFEWNGMITWLPQ